MTNEQKAVYNQKAKMGVGMSNVKEEKYDTRGKHQNKSRCIKIWVLFSMQILLAGVPLSFTENEKKRKLDEMKEMTSTIEDMVTHLYQRGGLCSSTQVIFSPYWNKPNFFLTVLPGQYFYIAFFNYAVETEEKEYPPCELGLVKYSLTSGIDDFYHEFIEPGISMYYI